MSAAGTLARASAASPAMTSPVKVLMPWADGAELALRERLHKARDLSASRAVAAAGYARSRALFWMIADLCTEWVVSPASVADLEDLTNAILRLFMVADALQRLEAPDGT